MIDFIAKKCVADCENAQSSQVRLGYGVASGVLGIMLNLLLFACKMVVGLLSGSVAIVADAFNNLSDMGSSLVMMVGFKMSGKKPDANHPFGHGRIEYVTGLIVSLLIILVGVELVKTSVSKIINPGITTFSIATVSVLLISVAVKLYMYYYNKKISMKINSSTMKAVSLDSIADAIATLVVLVGFVTSYYCGIKLDGWLGLVMSLFILETGFSSAKDTIDPLLGSKPSEEYVEAIEKYVTSNEGILGMHDLMIHDYGPGRMIISLHAEVPASGNILELHDTIDNIEKKLHSTLGCHAVIHMDPIVTDDDTTDRMKRLTMLIVKSVDESFSIHDFRMVKGSTHTNLIFDVLVPYESKLSDKEVASLISQKIEELPGNHYAVIEIDHPMT